MLISVDHGNKQMKTKNHIFTSGLYESDTVPSFGQDILKYNGKYYSIIQKRIPYMKDKTADERFFILTLFAIAYELQHLPEKKEIYDIQLAAGLPPKHFSGLSERFADYFKKRRNETEIISFEFNQKPISIHINDVLLVPQCYGAAVTRYEKIKNYSRVYMIDIGGFTLDYLLFENGKIDLSVCDSLENGVILMYNNIISGVSSTYDKLLSERDIDDILLGKDELFDDGVRNYVMQQAENFVVDIVNSLRERGLDLTSAKVVFTGGGSILLEKFFMKTGRIKDHLLIDDIAANVKGFEMLYYMRNGSR